MLANPSMPDTTSSKVRIPRSTLVSRNVTISGHRTSIRLEPEMWSGLSEICRREGASLHEVCTAVSSHKGENTSLTAAIRVFVMAYFRIAATEDGHTKAGHGYGVATLGFSGDVPRPAPISAPASSGPSQSYAGMSRGFALSSGNRNGNGR